MPSVPGRLSSTSDPDAAPNSRFPEPLGPQRGAVMSPPLSLSDPDAARTRSYADDIVTRLIEGYGFDNTSLSMWRSFLRPCDPDEQGRTTRPSCIEINTRTFAQFAPAYVCPRL